MCDTIVSLNVKTLINISSLTYRCGADSESNLEPHDLAETLEELENCTRILEAEQAVMHSLSLTATNDTSKTELLP